MDQPGKRKRPPKMYITESANFGYGYQSSDPWLDPYYSSFYGTAGGGMAPWRYNYGSGNYDNWRTGESMSGADFYNNTPYLSSPLYVDSRPESVVATILGVKDVYLYPGVDPAGGRMGLLTYEDGSQAGQGIPFWFFSRNYFHPEYFLSGVEAYGDLDFFKRIVKDNFKMVNYLPIAYSKELNISGEIGGAASVSPIGVIFMGGAEGFKIKSFGSVSALGIGMISINAQVCNMYYFYSGNRSAFTSDIFSGPSIDLEFTFGEGLMGSLNVSFMLDRGNPGEFLIGFGSGFGYGLSPTFWSASGTWQHTDYYGR